MRVASVRSLISSSVDGLAFCRKRKKKQKRRVARGSNPKQVKFHLRGELGLPAVPGITRLKESIR